MCLYPLSSSSGSRLAYYRDNHRGTDSSDQRQVTCRPCVSRALASERERATISRPLPARLPLLILVPAAPAGPRSLLCLVKGNSSPQCYLTEGNQQDGVITISASISNCKHNKQLSVTFVVTYSAYWVHLKWWKWYLDFLIKPKAFK